jgi:hypothetical protein
VLGQTIAGTQTNRMTVTPPTLTAAGLRPTTTNGGQRFYRVNSP